MELENDSDVIVQEAFIAINFEAHRETFIRLEFRVTFELTCVGFGI